MQQIADRSLVMGILNVTPDSFSDGGLYFDGNAAVERAYLLVRQGADIVDIGGESTRPGAKALSARQEWDRIGSVVRTLANTPITISVDTYHSENARRAVDLGADIVNDVTGGHGDPSMLSAIAACGCTYILQHNRGGGASRDSLASYGDVAADVAAELSASIDRAISAGVDASQIVIDPGFGFAKVGSQDWDLAARMEAVMGLGLPVLVGVSRKRFLAEVAAGGPESRDDATAALTAYFAQLGVWAVRVHEVAASRAAVETVMRLRRAGGYAARTASPAARQAVLGAGGEEPELKSAGGEEPGAKVVGGEEPGAKGSAARGRETIRIAGIRAEGRHGVHEEEKTRPQPFLVDVELEVLARTPASDDIDETISYSDVAADAVSVVEGPSVDLVETLAERIAERVLARGALRTTVTVHKPEAPVGIPFSDVSVSVRRDGPLAASGTIRRVVLALGANLGDPHANLDVAVKEIRELDVCVTAVSSRVKTAPVLAPGQTPQPEYLNAVLTLTTAMSPLDLLEALERIEVRLGRVRTERWGPRTIDLDIVDVDGVTSRNPRLTLPHPRAAKRPFVLEPWLEIEPEAMLAGVSVASLAAAEPSRGGECV